MQITPNPFRADRGAYALLTTLVIMGVLLLIFAGIFRWTSTNTVLTQRNNQYNMSLAAAEAAAEIVISQMDRDYISHVLSTNPAVYSALVTNIDQTSWPVKYVFSDTNGVANQVSLIIGTNFSTTLQSGQYKGLQSRVRNCTVLVKAMPLNQPQTVPAAIQEQVQFAKIPLFQFAIFFNVNLELDPGPPMTITGPVFCNQNIWEGSTKLTCQSSVQAAGTNSVTANNPFGPWKTGSAPAVFSLPNMPMDGATPLAMPIGTNNDPVVVRSVLDLPPANYAGGTYNAYNTEAGQVYPANEADLVISNAAYGVHSSTPTGSNIFIYFQDQGGPPYLTYVTNDFYILKNNSTSAVLTTNYVAPAMLSPLGQWSILYAGYSFATNSYPFGDWREMNSGQGSTSRVVQAVEINVTNLITWLNNNAVNGGAPYDNKKYGECVQHINAIYVYNSVPPTATTLPAVRMVKGAMLPASGLSVATPFPIYVKGDYNVMDASGSSSGNNTTHTRPADLMGDAITILSNGWNDSTTSECPAATTTTVNAATLGGIVQTSPLNPNLNGYSYSGGAHNFLRNLETWAGVTLNYNGSIVVPFYSQYATNQLASGYSSKAYYSPPNRNYAFDLNFLNDNLLPAMTPSTSAMVRGQWTAVNGF